MIAGFKGLEMGNNPKLVGISQERQKISITDPLCHAISRNRLE
jgi:hypothetical protein